MFLGSITYTSDPNEQIQLFNEKVKYLYEKHVLLQRLRTKPIVLTSEAMEKANIDRDLAHRKFRRSRSEEDWELFKRLREKCKRIESIELQNFYRHRFSPDLNNKDLWTNIKSLGYMNTPPDIKFFTSQELVKKFTGTVVDLHANTNLRGTPCSSEFCHTNISLTDTIVAVESIKSSAIGADMICPKFLKII